MKILIGQSYFRILDPKEENRKMPYPPLGTIILATLLDNKNYLISFFDSMLAIDTKLLYSSIDVEEPDLLILYDDEFNYLTKMSLLNMRENTFEIISYCNSKKIPVFIYTSDAIDHPELYLRSGATSVIHGEGEQVIQEILEKNPQIYSNSKFIFSNVAGVTYIESGALIANPKLPLINNLDDLPLPNYSKYVDIDMYKEIWIKNHGYFSLNISTSRGCVYGCNWCAKPLWGRTYNANSPKRIIELFEILEFKLGVDHVWITDDIFGLKKGWLKEFSELYQNSRLTIPYKCLSRADLLIKNDTLQYLANSNCEIIWIGAESGSQKILDAMEKGIKVEQVREVVYKAKAKGINIAFFIQFGYLGETWEDILLTKMLIIDSDPHDIGISVSYPLPETKFYSLVQSHLKEKQNWKDSSDLDMMFHGTFPRDFYRVLHKQVHNEFRFRKSLKSKNIFKSVLHGIKYYYYTVSLRKFHNNKSVQLPMVKT